MAACLPNSAGTIKLNEALAGIYKKLCRSEVAHSTNVDELCTALKQAHEAYNATTPQEPVLPPLKFKEFLGHLLQQHPQVLNGALVKATVDEAAHSERIVELLMTEASSQEAPACQPGPKSSTSTSCSAIVLDESCTYVLLTKDAKRKAKWTLPMSLHSDVNAGLEEVRQCAVQAVSEAAGWDITPHVVPESEGTQTIGGCRWVAIGARGVPLDSPVGASTAVGAVAWCPLAAIVKPTGDAKQLQMVQPFAEQIVALAGTTPDPAAEPGEWIYKYLALHTQRQKVGEKRADDDAGSNSSSNSDSDPCTNARLLLQVMCQKRKVSVPVYEVVERTGVQHKPLFVSTVTFWDGQSFRGELRPTHKKAHQSAAMVALAQLQQDDQCFLADPAGGPKRGLEARAPKAPEQAGAENISPRVNGSSEPAEKRAPPEKVYSHISEAPMWQRVQQYLLQKPAQAVDNKSRLQHVCQRGGLALPVYQIVEKHGPPHSCLFVVSVQLADCSIQATSRRSFRSVKEASQDAAGVVLEALTHKALAQDAAPASKRAKTVANNQHINIKESCGSDGAPFVLRTAKLMAGMTSLDMKSKLQQLCQKCRLPLPAYTVVESGGPGGLGGAHHYHIAQVTLWNGSEIVGTNGTTIKEAHQNAAAQAFRMILASADEDGTAELLEGTPATGNGAAHAADNGATTEAVAIAADMSLLSC